MYYFFMALVDIGFYISENWEKLTADALFVAVGIILGKRIGSRMVIKQMMKMFGLEKESKLEQKVKHHEQEIIKLGGSPWSVPMSKKRNAGYLTLLRSLRKAGLLVRFARFFTRPRAIYPSIRRNQKMREYLKKLGSRKFQSFVIGFITQLFILFKLDEGLYVNEIAAAGLIITTIVYIYIEGTVDKARGNTNEPDYTSSAETSE